MLAFLRGDPNFADMKAHIVLVAVVVSLVVGGISFARNEEVMVPRDFNKGLTTNSRDGLGDAPAYAGIYQNKIGVVVNPNIKTRDASVRPGGRAASAESAALFAGKQGGELAGIAATAAKANPGKAADIATAAIQRNIATGGSPETDLEIIRRIMEAMGTALNPETATTLIGLATERLPDNKIEGAVRQLRDSYLKPFGDDRFAETAKELDTALTTKKITLALTMSDEEYASWMSAHPTEGTTADTNPFFTGDQGINNVGGQFGGGGGGGSGTPAPTPKPTPQPPAS